MSYTCANCGAKAESPGHLCNPCDDQGSCSVNTVGNKNDVRICNEKLAVMDFVCSQCGRVAAKEAHLCKPVPNR